MRTLWQDTRYGVRMLLQRPGFTLTAAVVLALGIGANTALFSVVHAVLFSPLPFDSARRLVLIQAAWRSSNGTMSCSGPDYLDWAERNQVMEGLGAVTACQKSLTGAGEPLAVPGLRTTANFFDVLRPGRMTLGRGFRPEEGHLGSQGVTVLSHSLWRDRFHADPNILGRTITLDDAPFTVVGVAKPALGFLEEFARFYIPLTEEELTGNGRGMQYLLVVGRLKPGISLAQAQAQMDQVTTQIEKEHPDTNTDKRATIESLHEMLVRTVRTALLVLYGAVTVVLLVACVNVSNLLVAKGAVRNREIAVRHALGAGRGRLLRQLLTESTLLGLLGGVLGLALAFWGLDLLRWTAPRLPQVAGISIPGLEEARVSLPVLMFTMGLSLMAGLLFGVVPAWQGSRCGLSSILKETGQSLSRGRARHRTLAALVVAQIALAMMLLMGAGLLIKSFVLLQRSDPGFNSRRLLALHLVRPNTAANRSRQDRVAYCQRVLEQLAALPGAQAVGAIDVHPMELSTSVSNSFQIIGKEGWPSAETRVVSGDYFHCLGIPLVRGRTFTPEDNEQSQPVVVINQEFVRRHLPDRDPLGQVVDFGGIRRTIVGVVGNVKIQTLRSEDYPVFIYQPLAQQCGYGMTFFLRTAGDPLRWAGAMHKVLWDIDPSQPILYTETMDRLVLKSISVEHFCTILLTIMAGVALIMALVGLYGVMAFAVTERRNEIGIRMALGAREQDVLGLVLKKAVVLTVLGLLTGLACTLGVCRLLASLLYSTSAYDPATFVMVPLLLFAVAVLACYLPARRAARIDPMAALRYE
jgi:putative ABC transport system permease protein